MIFKFKQQFNNKIPTKEINSNRAYIAINDRKELLIIMFNSINQYYINH